MPTLTIERVIERNANKINSLDDRIEFVGALIPQIVEIEGFNKSWVAALDILLGGNENEIGNKTVIITQGEYKIKVNPCTRKNELGDFTEYGLRFFDRLYKLASKKGVHNEVIDCSIKISRNVLNLNYSFLGIPKEKIYEKKDFFYCNRMDENIFMGSNGVIIKKSSKNGYMRLNGGCIFVGKKNPEKKVITFFNRGKAHIFNLYAEKIKELNFN